MCWPFSVKRGAIAVIVVAIAQHPVVSGGADQSVYRIVGEILVIGVRCEIVDLNEVAVGRIVVVPVDGTGHADVCDLVVQIHRSGQAQPIAIIQARDRAEWRMGRFALPVFSAFRSRRLL